MQKSPTLTLGLLVLSLALGCGGEELDVTVDTGSPDGTGVVARVSGLLLDQAPEDVMQGRISFKFVAGDTTVSENVWVELATTGQEVGGGPASGHFDLLPGEYSARVVYQETALLPKAKGVLRGLKVNAGKTSSYKVVLDVPLGRLKVDFVQDRAGGERTSIADSVSLDLYPADKDHSGPSWSGPATADIVVEAGTYNLKATISGHGGEPIVEWYRGVIIAGGMATTDRTIQLEAQDSGVRVDVFNFSVDVNNTSFVAFFPPEADLTRAVARHSGRGGELLAVDPGTYDLLVRYQPTDEVFGDKLLRNFVVPVDGGIRKQVDVEKELALLKLSVFENEVDISERVSMLVKKAGADPVAGTSQLDVSGLGEHYIPAGTYDFYFSYRRANIKPSLRQVAIKGIALPPGAVLEQRFEASAARWVAAPPVLPTAPLRPIGWIDPSLLSQSELGDDDDSATSAGDDDDSAESAGDDDDSAESAGEAGDSVKSAGDDDDSSIGAGAEKLAPGTVPPEQSGAMPADKKEPVSR